MFVLVMRVAIKGKRVFTLGSIDDAVNHIGSVDKCHVVCPAARTHPCVRNLRVDARAHDGRAPTVLGCFAVPASEPTSVVVLITIVLRVFADPTHDGPDVTLSMVLPWHHRHCFRCERKVLTKRRGR